MKWPSNNTLIGIAGGLGFGVGCTGLFMHNAIQKNFKQTVFVSEALTKLRNHEAAKYLLGSPIRDFNIEFEDTANNYYNKDEAVYKIPVKGPNGHGYYFIKAQPRGEDGKWVGVKLELELEETKQLEKEKFQNKRLVVFDCDKSGFMHIRTDVEG